jgi:hypothetical protein
MPERQIVVALAKVFKCPATLTRGAEAGHSTRLLPAR